MAHGAYRAACWDQCGHCSFLNRTLKHPRSPQVLLPYSQAIARSWFVTIVMEETRRIRSQRLRTNKLAQVALAQIDRRESCKPI